MSTAKSTAPEASTKPKRQLDWFDNIENIRPVRGGHSAASVMSAVSAPRVTIEEARKKFSDDMKEAETAEEPLDIMLKYVKWFDDTFLSGKASVLQPLLYQIITKFGTDPRYRNDERIMKLWLKLADNFPERGFAVMQLACSRGSCKELAKFYIYWSTMYEYAEQMDRAREIIARGIYNRAVPITLLHEASDALEIRICRWTLEKQKRQDELDLSDDDLSHMEEFTGRRMFGRITVEETERGYRVPSVRDCSSTPIKIISKPKKTPVFEVYEEEPEPASTAGNANWTIPVVEEELNSDPDWQSIFGYRDNPKLHIDITENNILRKRPGGIPGIKPCPDQPLAAFSVYCETQKTKLKFALRRELIRDSSIEEAFLQRLLQQES